MRTKLLRIFYLPIVACVALLALYAFGGLGGADRESEAGIRLRFENPVDVQPLADSESEMTATSVPNREDLNALVGEAYLVSFLFKEEHEPKVNRRQKLVSKYDNKSSPYSGWAIALRQVPTSTRFEVYLKDSENNGGWFTLRDFPIVPGTTYAVTFVFVPGNFLSGYAAALQDDSTTQVRSKLHDLGGVPLTGLLDITSEAPLLVTSGRPKIGPFVGAVSETTVFRLAELPSESSLKSHLLGGPRTLLTAFPAECIISLSPEGAACGTSGNK